MGTRLGVKVSKTEKTFCHQQTTGNARPKKTNKIANKCFKQNNNNNGFSTKKTFGLLFQKIDPS